MLFITDILRVSHNILKQVSVISKAARGQEKIGEKNHLLAINVVYCRVQL